MIYVCTIRYGKARDEYTRQTLFVRDILWFKNASICKVRRTARIKSKAEAEKSRGTSGKRDSKLIHYRLAPRNESTKRKEKKMSKSYRVTRRNKNKRKNQSIENRLSAERKSTKGGVLGW